MDAVTNRNKKPATNTTQGAFAVQCKKTNLYILNLTPYKAAIEISPVEALSFRFESFDKAKDSAAGLQILFGSFDWQAVKVRS